MDRKMLESHLRQALAHVASGRKHIARQREIIARLEAGGHDSTIARELLTTFEDVQITYEADLDRFETALANAGERD